MGEYVPELPLPFADSHLVPAIETRAGQTGDFLAVATHALGLRTHHLDLLGDDNEGDLVRALHRDRGIPLTEGPLPGGTRRAVNLVGPDGRRCSLYDGSRSQEVGELPPETVRSPAGVSHHVHVSISRPCAASLQLPRDLGATVSTDLHDWDGANPYHEPFAYAAGLVFLSAAALADRRRPCAGSPSGAARGRSSPRTGRGARTTWSTAS